MGWETRQRGGRYYTRSRRVNGRVEREYVGSGVVGELAAELDAIDREHRLQQAAQRREHQQESIDDDNLLKALERITEGIGRGTLLLAGYHQHNRGNWRLRKCPNPKHS